ncbi:MAG TPA: type I restriction enzyme endonuclease domain-containing protein [Planctomycetota bacterium]|nr:type I restriction enzyme endonuclease domain-containing protein [Planctomycetota bacterium]
MRAPGEARPQEELDHAVCQILSRRKNVVRARSFAEMLEQTIRRYQNRAVEAVLVGGCQKVHESGC